VNVGYGVQFAGGLPCVRLWCMLAGVRWFQGLKFRRHLKASNLNRKAFDEVRCG
jgi:hypothetical protein